MIQKLRLEKRLTIRLKRGGGVIFQHWNLTPYTYIMMNVTSHDLKVKTAKMAYI